jgi:hypothetical protein
MWRFAIVCLGLMLFLVAPASAQYYAPPPYRAQDPAALVNSWYHRFLGRDLDPSGLQTWTDALRQGQPQDAVLGTILGSQEYYDRAGGTEQGFVQSLYTDLLGRYPTQGEMSSWLGRMPYETNQGIASALLRRYPESWGAPAPSYYRGSWGTRYYPTPRLRYRLGF